MNLCHQTNNGRFAPTHGMKGTKIYRIWQAMLARTRYGRKDYAGRGIVVCDAWHKFENFYADMGDVPEGMSLDRIDNNGNYEPSNCRWASHTEQMNNKRNNVFIEWNGKKQTVRQWERELNMKPTTLRSRLKYGWSLEKAMQPLPAENE